jgi:hypothetical protein
MSPLLFIRAKSYLNRRAHVEHRLTAHETFSSVHSDRPDSVFTKMLRDFEYESDFMTLDF